MLHCTPVDFTIVGDDCVVGHIVHLEDARWSTTYCVGNAAQVLHRAVIRTGARIVAANSVVLYDTEVPAGALAVAGRHQGGQG